MAPVTLPVKEAPKCGARGTASAVLAGISRNASADCSEAGRISVSTSHDEDGWGVVRLGGKTLDPWPAAALQERSEVAWLGRVGGFEPPYEGGSCLVFVDADRGWQRQGRDYVGAGCHRADGVVMAGRGARDSAARSMLVSLSSLRSIFSAPVRMAMMEAWRIKWERLLMLPRCGRADAGPGR